MKIRKSGIYFVVVLLMVSFVFNGVDMNVYAETKKIGIGNLTENDLVAAWYFDEDSGDLVKDYKGNYNGTANGTTVIDTPYGKGRSFDGIDDYIQLDNTIMPVGKKSVRFKIKKHSLPEPDQWEIVISNAYLVTSSYGLYAQIRPDNGKLDFYILNSSGSYDDIIDLVQTPFSVCDGQWHDILFTWDGKVGTENVKLYVNDMSVPVSVGNGKRLEENTPSYNLRIGEPGGAPTNFPCSFKGEITQIEIYNEAYAPPAEPTSLTATAGDSKVDLSWGSVTDVDSYNVKRSLTTGGPYTTVAQEVYGTTYTDTDVVNGTTYYYAVSSVQNGAESPDSNEVSATPEGGSSSGDRALFRITMSNGTINEYDLSMSDINSFIDWCDNRNKPYYIIEKDYNIKPFESRKDYIIFEKISQFEVMEYKN